MKLLSGLSLLVLGLGRPVHAWEATQRPLGRVNAVGVDSVDSVDAAPSYRDDLLALHRGLIEVPSQSGAEGDVGDWLVAYLAAHSYRCVRQPLPPRDVAHPQRRFNVIAWPVDDNDDDMGSDAADKSDALDGLPSPLPRVLVSSHIDVVPPYIPYSIDGDGDGGVTAATVVRGRGSVDAKASVAAQVTAVEQLRRAGGVAAGDVLLLFVVGEEDSGDGMRFFSDALARQPGHAGFAAAIFGEPTENRLACGHKGILGCTVAATGRAGHSGYPWLGKSANEVLVRGLVALLDADLGSSPVFGNTTLNVGLLHGGVAFNVIPAAASAGLAVRVATGPQASGHEIARTRMAAALARVDPDALDLQCTQGYGVVECNCDVEGFSNITVNYGTDVPNLAGNHTRYLYGPGTILVAHSDDEAITVGDLEAAVEGYKALVQHALAQ